MKSSSTILTVVLSMSLVVMRHGGREGGVELLAHGSDERSAAGHIRLCLVVLVLVVLGNQPSQVVSVSCTSS